jgi:hypothetical protein
MTVPATAQHQKEALQFLEETFQTHHGIYIDKGTTLLDTLADVTAEEASQRASDRTASIGAHVRHITFYLEVMQPLLRGEKFAKVNWREIWETDRPMNSDEWSGIVRRLREEYEKVCRLHADPATWNREDALGEFTAISIHTAYHLGAIRQILPTVRSRAKTGR